MISNVEVRPRHRRDFVRRQRVLQILSELSVRAENRNPHVDQK
jgi:hypothetical protein